MKSRPPITTGRYQERVEESLLPEAESLTPERGRLIRQAWDKVRTSILFDIGNC